MPEEIKQLDIKYIFTIFLIISFSGPIVAEAFKKIVKGTRSFKTGTDKDDIKVNPWILYGLVALIDFPACFIFTFFILKELWLLSFVPIFVFSASIIGYEIIIKNVLELFEAVGTLLKRFIIGNKKHTAIDEGIIRKNGFDQ